MLRVVVGTGSELVIYDTVKSGNQPFPAAHACRNVKQRQSIELRNTEARFRSHSVVAVLFTTRITPATNSYFRVATSRLNQFVVKQQSAQPGIPSLNFDASFTSRKSVITRRYRFAYAIDPNMRLLTGAQTIQAPAVPLLSVDYCIWWKGAPHKIRCAGVVNDEITRRRQRPIDWTAYSRVIDTMFTQVAFERVPVNRDGSPDQIVKRSGQFSRQRPQFTIHLHRPQQTSTLDDPLFIRKRTGAYRAHASLRGNRPNNRQKYEYETNSHVLYSDRARYPRANAFYLTPEAFHGHLQPLTHHRSNSCSKNVPTALRALS